MENYRHILVAVDFSAYQDQIIERALDLARKHGAQISLIHVVENLPIGDASYGPIVPFDFDLTEQLIEAARERLDRLGDVLGIEEARRIIEVGSAKAEIVHHAKEQGVDLVVLGSHGRHGIALLLGSTASSVIHHAPCDVLAVRIKEETRKPLSTDQ